jgi:2,4-didehydro-3-deoxy-L-rhamnonate hydrolase
LKLLRYGPRGAESPGLLDRDGNIRDLSAVIDDIDGASLISDALSVIRGLDVDSLPIVPGMQRLGSCVARPNDPIVQPRASTKLDWEVELAFAIGSECRYVTEAEGAAAIAGYFICNDVSERAFQMERGGRCYSNRTF